MRYPAVPCLPHPYSRKAAAQQLSISVRSFDTLVAEGMIPVRRVKGRVLVSHNTLLRFAEAENPPEAD